MYEYSQPGAYEAKLARREQMWREVERLDPALLAHPEAKLITQESIGLIEMVSEDFGSPDAPRWHVGDAESTIMTYHNGESAHSQGHTSIGEGGAGVPRNVLVIAKKINDHAGREVVKPMQRARAFAAAAGHDAVQLCGRSIAYVKAGEIGGDEMRSAQGVYDALRFVGVKKSDCQRAAVNVLATMFDPETKQQTIDYNLTPDAILEQQLVACADLVGSICLPRGPLCSLENVMEVLGMSSNQYLLQRAMTDANMTTHDLSTPEALIEFIDTTPSLRQKCLSLLKGQVAFFESFTFSDSEIRNACGFGIDELFPGRAQNVATLQHFVALIENGGSFYGCWQLANAATAQH